MNYLITGAASGIGLATAELFQKQGHKVFSLDILPSELQGVRSFTADITDEAAVKAIAEKLSAEGVRLDGIISVAGIHTMASFVENDFSRIKKVIDVNLLGAMLVCRAFHPLLSKDGRVVIVTSEVATYSPMPFNGIYNVSKTALESFAQALRQELNLIGQRVITIRPGAVETPLAKGSADSTAKLAEETLLYKKQAKHFSGLVRRFTGTPMKPYRLARLIHKATVSKHPRLSYSKNRNIGLVLLNLLPLRLQCAVIKMLLNR